MSYGKFSLNCPIPIQFTTIDHAPTVCKVLCQPSRVTKINSAGFLHWRSLQIFCQWKVKCSTGCFKDRYFTTGKDGVIETTFTLHPATTKINKIHPTTAFKTLDIRQQQQQQSRKKQKNKTVISKRWETVEIYSKPYKSFLFWEFSGPRAGKGEWGTGVDWTPWEKMELIPGDKTTRVCRGVYWRQESCTELEHQTSTEGPLEQSAEYWWRNVCEETTQWGGYHPPKLKGTGLWIVACFHQPDGKAS